MQKTFEFGGKVFDIINADDDQGCCGCHFESVPCTGINDAVEDMYGQGCVSGGWIYVGANYQKQKGEKKMTKSRLRVEMPKVDLEQVQSLPLREPCIVKSNIDGGVYTALRVSTEVLIAGPEGLGWEDMVSFEKHYTILRPYAPGEKLVIEV